MESISDFPNEILAMIFSHLYEKGDLTMILKYTIISPRINSIISTNLLLKISWSRRLEKKEIPSTSRTYSRLVLKNLSKVSSKLKKFIERHGDTLTYLSIACCSFKIAELLFLLRKTSKTLRHLRYSRNLVEKDSEMAIVEFPELRIFSVNVGAEGSFSLYSIISAPKLSHCFFKDSTREKCFQSTTDMCDFASFVLLQENLKVLYVSSFVADVLTEYWAALIGLHETMKPKLKLTSLSIHFMIERNGSIQKNSENLIGFRSLLESQRSSLKILRLEQVRVAGADFDFITRFKLDKLLLNHINAYEIFDLTSRNHKVRDFYFGHYYDEMFKSPNYFDVLSCIKGDQRFRVLFRDDRFEIIQKLSKSFPNFTQLEVGSVSRMGIFTMHSVQTLILKETDPEMMQAVIEIVRENPQLKSLVLHERFEENENFEHQLKSLLPSATISFKDFSVNDEKSSDP